MAMNKLNLRYTPPLECVRLSRGHTLLTYDPDLNGGGFCLGGVFPSAGLAVPRGAFHVHEKGSPLDVLEAMSMLLRFEVGQRSQLVIMAEKPKKRKHQRSKHRSVEKLDGMLRAVRRYFKPAVWVTALPEKYKAQTPKRIHHARAWLALTPDEQAHAELRQLNPNGASYQHDAADAIALWLWAVGRLGVGGRRA